MAKQATAATVKEVKAPKVKASIKRATKLVEKSATKSGVVIGKIKRLFKRHNLSEATSLANELLTTSELKTWFITNYSGLEKVCKEIQATKAKEIKVAQTKENWAEAHAKKDTRTVSKKK